MLAACREPLPDPPVTVLPGTAAAGQKGSVSRLKGPPQGSPALMAEPPHDGRPLFYY